MSVAGKLRNALGPVVAGKVYADKASPKVTPPFIVFERTSIIPVGTVHASAPVATQQYYRISIWDSSRNTVESLRLMAMSEIDKAIAARELVGAYDGEEWGYDETMEYECCALDYWFWENTAGKLI